MPKRCPTRAGEGQRLAPGAGSPGSATVLLWNDLGSKNLLMKFTFFNWIHLLVYSLLKWNVAETAQDFETFQKNPKLMSFGLWNIC